MIVGLLIAVAAAFFVLERCWPALELPKVRGWWARVALLNTAQAILVILAGLTWDRWMSRTSLFHLSSHAGDLPAALVAYLVSCVIYYWWHRLRHESKWFWRVCHQLHHSPQRIELLTSFYKHPVEIALNSILTSAIVYLLLGCNVHAAGYYTLIIAVAEYFYHWNIRTPHWLGNFIQRPESHRVHHEYDRHTKNYADLPILDWIFGTFENPRREVKRCGFSPEKEARFKEMLLLQDVGGAGSQPTCIGCRKRWICRSVASPPAEIKNDTLLKAA